MCRITTLLALTLMLFGGLLVAAAPTAAAPAEPYEIERCTTWFSGDTFCIQEKGVIKKNESASDNVIYVAHRQRCVQHTSNGAVLYEACSNSHLNLVQKDGVPHVYHSRLSNEYTFVSSWNGVTYTCTYSDNFVYANGEVRHEDSQHECNPPL